MDFTFFFFFFCHQNIQTDKKKGRKKLTNKKQGTAAKTKAV